MADAKLGTRMAFWNPVANVVVGSASQDTFDFAVLAWHPTDMSAVTFVPPGRAFCCAGVSSSGKHNRQHLALLSGTLPPPLIYTCRHMRDLRIDLLQQLPACADGERKQLS